MMEKDLAYLAFELTVLLTTIFQKNKINQETYIANTIIKVQYLEEYLKKNQDHSENTRIMELLSHYNKILKPACSSSR